MNNIFANYSQPLTFRCLLLATACCLPAFACRSHAQSRETLQTQETRSVSRIDSLSIHSYASPDGNHARNACLAHKRPLLAIKTNFLFDAALMPNIEVELPLHKRWSLNGELLFPWWLADGDKYCLQILMGSLEGRYWLGNRENREVLTGHFLGLYAGGGKYDLQWNRNGYQSELFTAAGVSYGYAHKIARNLRLEYSIGVGLLHTHYKHYHTLDNYKTLLWQDNGRYTWLGPTKLKISLVWLLNRQVKTQKGGGQ